MKLNLEIRHMSTIQDRSFNNDLAAALGDVVRARRNVYSDNYAGVSNASDANLAAQIAPVVLTSLRTLAQHGGQPVNGSQWQQQAQPGYQTQQELQAQQGQQNAGQQPNAGYQQNAGQLPRQGSTLPQGQEYQRPVNGSNGTPQLSPRGTLAAVVTPIVAEALARYQPQNAAGGYSQPRPLDRDWLESISSVVADVTPTVVDALKTFQPQHGTPHSANAANLQAAAQRGAFDDLTSVVAATLPVVVNALRDYQPQQAQPSRRNGFDDVADVARLAAPIAIGAL
jgi:hypothetical protein